MTKKALSVPDQQQQDVATTPCCNIIASSSTDSGQYGWVKRYLIKFNFNKMDKIT